MNCDNVKVLWLVLSILLTVWFIASMHNVKVYRFYRPSCPYCVNSQDEWDKFKRKCMFSMVKPVDVNMNEATDAQKKLAENFMVKSVPHVVAVYDDGLRFTYDGSRTADAYMNWVNRHGTT